MLLLSIALVTSTIAAPDQPTAESVELVEKLFDDAVTETAAPTSAPTARMIDSATTAAMPASPPVAAIFRPPRLPS